MALFGKIYSFRARISLLLTLTLIATTAVLYELNRRAERNITEEVERQRIELADAIDIAQQSIFNGEWLVDYLQNRRRQAARDQSHVKRILIVDPEGKVFDSSSAEDINMPFSSLGFGDFEELLSPDDDASDQKLANSGTGRRYQMFKFPLKTKTTDDASGDLTGQTFHLVIIFSPEDLNTLLQASSQYRLLVTGGVLMISILISLLLVWNFTKPVGILVEAAKQVADGDFNVCLSVKRPDELGRLMAVFNEMVEGLRERRELEARLYRAEQSAIVGRLASGIAHEVKNPLNYISLTIDYLRSKYAPVDESAKEKFYEKMDGIKDEIKRLDRLIRNFLSYGRPLNLNLKPTDIRDLIGSVLSLSSDQAEQQSIEIAVDQNKDVPIIEADAERLKSCFSNLVLNAQQAMSNGGLLSVEFRRKDEGIEVILSDTGSGIAPENIAKIFEPYFSTKETGTGLGLPLVKRIVEGHGGRINVESELDRGTTFTVWLPNRPPASAGEASETFRIERLESLPAI